MSSNWSNVKQAPCTIFSTTKLSPRQIANKAYSLGCKKLERDDKRNKPKYHVRERLLINNTMNRAEEVLNSRTRRTNRRVMDAEEDDQAFLKEFSMKKTFVHNNINHSPLILQHEEELYEDDEPNIPKLNEKFNSICMPKQHLFNSLRTSCRNDNQQGKDHYTKASTVK